MVVAGATGIRTETRERAAMVEETAPEDAMIEA